MKRVYESDVCKLAEELSDMVWHDFDMWNKKVQMDNVYIAKMEKIYGLSRKKQEQRHES
jgi:hypothetical protein